MGEGLHDNMHRLLFKNLG